jgi:hypothetical protein
LVDLNVSVRSNLLQVAAQFDRIADNSLNLAAMRALNRAATTVRKEASSEIRKVYNLTAAVAKAQMKITRATKYSLEAVVTAKGKPIGLIDFSARQTARGVTVKVRRDSGRKLIPHAFVAAGRGGGEQVFLRVVPGTEKTTRLYREKRVRRKGSDLPIVALKSVSVARALVSKAVFAALKRVAQSEFVKNFNSEMKYELSKLK